MAAPTFKELRKMNVSELISTHDRLAKDTGLGISYYLNELARRDQSKQTNCIIIMTAIVTIATIVNVVMAAYN